MRGAMNRERQAPGVAATPAVEWIMFNSIPVDLEQAAR